MRIRAISRFLSLKLPLVASFVFVTLWAERLTAEQAAERADIIVVVGAPGTAEYAEQFSSWAQRWKEAAQQAKAGFTLIGPPADSSGDANDKEQLLTALEEADAESAIPLWVVLIGHGTFYQNTAKFNLVGVDVSAKELSNAIAKLQRPLVIVNTASASGPFIDRLSAPDRILVTATKSGLETNFARFGRFFSNAIGSSKSDLDHDDEVSVLEAFLHASEEVQQFYESASRLTTEHALLDDNGDKKGTPASLYKGLRPAGEAKDGSEIDGRLARRITLAPAANRLPLTQDELNKRDQLENAVAQLRSRREGTAPQEYYVQLEELLLQLALIYEQAEQRQQAQARTSSSEDDGSKKPQ